MPAPHYPHVIRARGRALFWHAFGCALFVPLALWLISVTWPAEGEDHWVLLVFIPLWSAIGLFGAWEASVVLTQTTVFDATGVTVQSMWGTRGFERSQMEGWRWGGERAGLRAVELYKKDEPRPFSVWINKESDDVVVDWFGDAVDLAHKDTLAALDDVKRDETFGHNADERIVTVDAESRLVGLIGIPVLAAAIWVLVFPRPYRVALGVAMAIPILTVVVTFLRRDRWRLQRSDGDFRPSTGNWIILAAVGLWLRAFYDWHLLNWGMAALYAAIFGMIAALAVAALFGELAQSRANWFSWILIAALYGYGAIIPLNTWLDRAEPVVHRARVLELGGDWVELAAPAPFPSTLNVDISHHLAERLSVDGEACLYRRAGALGVRSFYITVCPSD
jgi:hypothetical protein